MTTEQHNRVAITDHPAVSEQVGPSTCHGLGVLQLERECEVFSRYLLGIKPTSYLVEHYVDFHVRFGFAQSGGNSPFDSLLLRIARITPWLARFVDSYASLFCRSASIRKKLVLLLGLMECVPPSAQRLDEASQRSALVVATLMAIQFLWFFIHLAIATLLLGPVHLLLRRS